MFWQAFEIVHLYQVERNWSLRTENLNVARLLTRWGLEALGFEERWCRNQEEGCCKVAEALIRQCRGLGKYICLYSVSVNRLTIHHNKQPLNLNFFLKNDWPMMLTDKTFRGEEETLTFDQSKVVVKRRGEDDLGLRSETRGADRPEVTWARAGQEVVSGGGAQACVTGLSHCTHSAQLPLVWSW